MLTLPLLIQQGLATKAPLADPALTGTPTAPTASSGTNTTQIATTAFVQQEVTTAGSYNDASVDTHLNIEALHLQEKYLAGMVQIMTG